MQIALVQLSDIHLKAAREANPILQHGAAIGRAVASVCMGVSHGVLVISGDIAFSGSPGEYAFAEELIQDIKSVLKDTFNPTNFSVLTIPGNHDCHFGQNTSVRNILIDSVKPGQLDEAVFNACTDAQNHYFEFANKHIPTNNALTTSYDKLYRRVELPVASKRVVFHLVNSAWGSQKEEKQGNLYYPVDILKDKITNAGQADLAVAVLHHPFNWYSAENARQLRQILEDNTDLILTGHEHVPGAYQKCTDQGEQNEYLEGGVLQDSHSADNSTFNVVIFDTAKGEQQTHRFELVGDGYAPEGEALWRPFERNKRLVRKQFDFTDSFYNVLEDAGAGYTHPHKDPVTLNDIFIYPDVREISLTQEGSEGVLVRGSNLLTHILNNTYVLFLGEEKAGKTSLAKTLVKDLQRNGKVPVLLNGEQFHKQPDIDKIRKRATEQVETQYGSGRVDKYWQLDKDRRVVIVDDFHKTPFNRSGRSVIAGVLKDLFGHVVFLGGEELRLEELSMAGDEEKSHLLDFKQCSILQFGYVLRHRLVEKWCRLGKNYTDNEIETQRAIKRAEDQISTVISIDFIPSFPTYVLILLQQLEIASKLTTQSGSFGYLYEVLVTASLARKRNPKIDIDAKYNYLTEFSYYLYNNQRHSLTLEEMRDWHKKYTAEYRLTFDFDDLLGELVEAEVMDNRHGEYKFRYKYLYYFFVGRYFRDHINEDTIQSRIDDLSRRLYHEESANIMIFLCHLSKDDRVLNAMLAAARNLFTETARFDVSKNSEFFNKLNVDLPKIMLAARDPRENQNKALESRDEQNGRHTGSIAHMCAASECADELTPQLAHNAAFKTIQILGQVLRNFTGSLRGDPKRQLVEECYGLGLRVLGDIFDNAEKSMPQWVEGLSEYIKSRGKKVDEAKIQTSINRFIYNILQAVTCGVIKHVSDSVGTEKAEQTLNEVAKGNDNATVQVIDMAVKLDHYKDFPKVKIEALIKEFAKNNFALAVVRRIVWQHFYLFTTDYALKQQICQKLGITVEQQTKLLSQAPKRQQANKNTEEVA
jgi:hypothetical protein